MENAMIKFVFFIFIRVLYTVFGGTCRRNEDCEMCGVCVDKNISEKECFYPYPETIIENNTCYFKRDLCEGYLCENGGKCSVEFGFSGPSCRCPFHKWFMGQHCNIKWDKADADSYVMGFAVIFDLFREKSKSMPVYAIYLFASLYSSSRNLQFYAETSEGFAINFNNPKDCSYVGRRRIHYYYPLCTSCWTVFPPCIVFYQAKIQFPYKLASTPEMITRSGNVIGYMSNITLVANTFKRSTRRYQEIYRSTHSVMVNYEDLQADQRLHMPTIELQNCGKTLSQRIYYLRRSTISLNAKVKDTPKDFAQSTWTIWDLNKFRDDYDNPDVFQINVGYSLTLKPFTLETKVYRIELNVNIIFGQKSVANYAECYIEVIKSTAVAVISGGWTKTVNNKDQITISGEKSYSPGERRTNQNLKFFWSCSPKCDKFFYKENANNSRLIFQKEVMEFNKTYNFTLKVSAEGLEDGWAFQEVFVSDEEMSIYCLMNCLKEVVPSDPLLVEVKLPDNGQMQHTFTWMITDEVGVKVDVDSAICKHHTFPTYLLCIEPNTLNYGKTYYFNAKKSDSPSIAALRIWVGQVPAFSCLVTPNKGVQFITPFELSCSNPGGHSSWVFEFFDKYDSDLNTKFSGRMIATNSLGVLNHFKLFRGTICVYLFDVSGLLSQWHEKIELTPYNATREEIDILLIDIENMIKMNEMDLALKKVSLLSELISQRPDKSSIAKIMVHLISQISYASQGIMKLGLITVQNFVLSLTKMGDYKIDQSMLKSLTYVIHRLTRWTDYAMDLSDTAIPSITNRMMYEMATVSVEAIETVLANRNESFLDTSLEDLNPSDYEDALQSSIQVDFSLSHIGRVLSFRQGTGYPETSISSSSNSSLVSAQSDYLHLIAKQINSNKECPLKMSDLFIKGLSSVEELTIHLTTITNSPFWTDTKILSTNLLSLDLYNKNSLDSKFKRIEHINEEIDLFLEVLQPKVGSVKLVVTQLDPASLDEEELDNKLTVLRLDLVRHGKLFLMFSFQDSGDSIKVNVNENFRPDYKGINSSEILISSSNPSYGSSASVSDVDRFVYIGILPGPNVRVNASINVTVHFHYQLCLTWLRHKWVSHYCRVGYSDNSSLIHCSCTHLSFFSAIFAVPPNELDPFIDIALFLTLKDNWFVAAFMACLVVLFVLLAVWAKFKDAKDEAHRTVLILEDNFPEDINYYLLAVFTGCRLNAGTNANVGIQIIGSESSSRSHILKSSRRKVLKRNSEDWFMIQTPEPLGVIKQIHIWHDNSGESPDWYCYKMVVYDIRTTFAYTFFVEQWLALESGEFCEAVIYPATSEDICNVKRILLENIAFGFRDSDMSGSILARHPRSRVDRLDRVIILMCFTMTALLVSLAFYKSSDASAGYDNFGFSFDSQDILVSFQTFVISSAFIFLITFTFSRAYKPKREQRDRVNASFLYTRPSQRPTVMEKQVSETSGPISTRSVDNNSCYHRLVRRMRTTLHPMPLSPVALSKSSARVKKNRIIYLLAWFLSISLISCCVFFIILYGLKLGQEESKTWIASITLVLVQEFLIMSPLKIVFIGLVLATTFERFVQISNYCVAVEDLLKKGKVKSQLQYSSMIDNRAKQMYKPVGVIECDMLRKDLRLRNILHNQLDLVIVITYIVIICLVTSDYGIKVQSNANFHVSQIINLKHSSKDTNFSCIRNITQYYEYLDRTFVANLYAKTWYNNEVLNPPELKLQRKWWTVDRVTRLVGSPVCRQIRVDPKKCSLSQITKNSSVECIPNWSSSVEDDDNYDFEWKMATTSGADVTESSPWKYVSPSKSGRLSRQGESWTTYHGGGYMVQFSSDMFETTDMIQILTESKWINEFTRVIFLSFTIFNVNENMFTEVVLIAEHLPFGLYVTRTIIDSVRLDMVHSVWKAGFILFILIILFHVVKFLRLLSRLGFIRYFSEFVNIYQLTVIGLGILSIVCFVVHLKNSIDYTEMFQRRGLDEFFEFDEIVYYSIISANTLTILFCCLSFRLFSLWPFGGSSLNIYHTLLYSGKSITRFLVLLFVYTFVYCRLVSYLCNRMLAYSAFFWLWSKSVIKCFSTAERVILFLLSFSVKLCLVYILLLFCYHYKLGKGRKMPASDFVVIYNWLIGRLRR